MGTEPPRRRIGAISADEMTAAIGRERTAALANIAALKGRTTALGQMGGASRLASYQSRNLIYQLNDVGVSLASGMNPMMVEIWRGSRRLALWKQWGRRDPRRRRQRPDRRRRGALPLYGGDGNDVIMGRSDGDLIEGGAGNGSITVDLNYYPKFTTTVLGGTGDDDIRTSGSYGTVHFDGGEGNDTIDASTAYQSTLLGGTGDDRINSGIYGHNRVEGGAGDDLIHGFGGSDTLLGGDGDDRIIALPHRDGSGGRDLADGGNGNDLIVGGDDGATLLGGNGDDVIFGGASRDVISGGYGADRIEAGGGNDRVDGGGGDDVIRLGSGDDFVAAVDDFGRGDDRIWGEAGNDWMHGGRGDDTLDGGDGDDRLNGGAGNDLLKGGAGGRLRDARRLWC